MSSHFPLRQILFAKWESRYHDGCTLNIHVFFEFAQIIHCLFLEAVVLLSPHFALFEELLVDGYAGATVAGTEVLWHNEIIKGNQANRPKSTYPTYLWYHHPFICLTISLSFFSLNNDPLALAFLYNKSNVGRSIVETKIPAWKHPLAIIRCRVVHGLLRELQG